jgi:hypothetical protein
MVPMTFDRDEAVKDIVDDVGELVEERKHVEPYYEWTPNRNRKLVAWPTVQPSLLDQLRALVDEPLVEEVEGSARSIPRSRSPLGDDALDRLMAIETASAWWASVKLRRDLRDTVEENLRLLVGMAGRLDDADLRRLAADIRRWHGWAATLTGWQTPPWSPRAACPLCERTGTLRVLLDKKRGTCLGCGENWTEEDGSIGLLADHIRDADPELGRVWQAGCDHSWRLTVVNGAGTWGWCRACHRSEARRSWPKSTPVWTELDGQVGPAGRHSDEATA